MMEKYLEVLCRSRLFASLEREEVMQMLSCLGAAAREYSKGEYVFHEGDTVPSLSILVEGSLSLHSDDFWGRRTILGTVDVGEVFALSYEGLPLAHDVVALVPSAVISFDISRVLRLCSSACSHHSTVVENLFRVMSERNRALVSKLGHMSRRTTREKLLSYLTEEAKRRKSDSFELPFTRQQLADYLAVDRSAMTIELGRMASDGLIRFSRRSFTLLKDGQ